jgi:hypothetical protein
MAHLVPMSAVICKTVTLAQFHPPFLPNRHTSVPLLYNRQKSPWSAKYPTLTQLLPNLPSQNGILLDYCMAG